MPSTNPDLEKIEAVFEQHFENGLFLDGIDYLTRPETFSNCPAALVTAARLHLLRGEYQEAQKKVDRALRHPDKFGYDEATAHRINGEIAYYTSSFSEAARHVLASIRKWQEVLAQMNPEEHPDSYARANRGIGKSYVVYGRIFWQQRYLYKSELCYNIALQYYQIAQPNCRSYYIAQVLTYYAELLLEIEQYDRSHAFLQLADTIFLEAGLKSHFYRAATLIHLAQIQYKSGTLQDVEDSLERAGEVLHGFNEVDPRHLAHLHKRLTRFWMKKHFPFRSSNAHSPFLTHAKAAIEKAIDLLGDRFEQSEGHHTMAYCHNEFSRVYYRERAFHDAISQAQQALEWNFRGQATPSTDHSTLSLEEVKKFRSKKELLYSLRRMMLSYFKWAQDTEGTQRIYRLDRALHYAKLTIQVIDSLRKLSDEIDPYAYLGMLIRHFHGKVIEILEFLEREPEAVRQALSSNRESDIFKVFQQAKSWELYTLTTQELDFHYLDPTGNFHPPESPEPSPIITIDLDAVLQAVQLCNPSLRDNLPEMIRALHSRQDQLIRRRKKIKEQFLPAKFPTLREVTAALDEAAMIISYFQTDNHLYAMTIRGGDAKQPVHLFKLTAPLGEGTPFRDVSISIAAFKKYFIPSPSQEFLDDYVRPIHPDVSVFGPRTEAEVNPKYADFIACSGFLYKVLIRPLDIPTTVTALYIIPDKELHSVIFESLIDEVKPENQQRVTFRNLTFLIHHYSVAYANSTSLAYIPLNSSRQGSESSQTNLINLLAFGTGIQYTESGNVSPKQKEAERYARNMYNQLPVDQTDHFFPRSEEESESLFNRLEQYDVLLFFGHSKSDAKGPKQPALLLFGKRSEYQNARDPSEPVYFLEQHRIIQLRLRCKLLLLISCLGDAGAWKDEPISLNRAFLLAGSHHAYYTKYRIGAHNIGPAAELLCRHLGKGKSFGEALQQMKLDLINSQNSSNPRKWAGILFRGNLDNRLPVRDSS